MRHASVRQRTELTNTTVAAALARDAAGAIAATHDALTRPHVVAYLRMGAVLLDDVASCMRIVRAIAAGIEVHLGVGCAHGAEDQCNGGEEFFHVESRVGEEAPIVASKPDLAVSVRLLIVRTSPATGDAAPCPHDGCSSWDVGSGSELNNLSVSAVHTKLLTKRRRFSRYPFRS